MNLARKLILWGFLAFVVFIGCILVERYVSRYQRNAERMQPAIAQNQACIDGIAQRNPAIDVAQDSARGDPTPIGITNMPHEPAEFRTRYPAAVACGNVNELGEYIPTGKWFKHTLFAFDNMPAPNAQLCEAAARHYVEAYNLEMSRRAPRAVVEFCLRRGGSR